MPIYERRNDTGEVIERVRTVDGSLEDTRLGVAALEGRGDWVRVDETGPAAPVPPSEVLDVDAVKRRKGKPKED